MAHGPGPNDWNAVITTNDEGVKIVTLAQGLGADEPTDEQRLKTARATEAHLAEVKKQIQATLNTLSEKEKAMLERERAVEARERAMDLAERERTGGLAMDGEGGEDDDGGEGSEP